MNCKQLYDTIKCALVHTKKQVCLKKDISSAYSITTDNDCARVLDIFQKDFSKQIICDDFSQVFDVLLIILQKYPNYAKDVLDVSELIFMNYKKISYTLIFNIINITPEYLPRIQKLLEKWFETGYYDEGNLIGFYQFLNILLEHHSELKSFIYNITMVAMQSPQNGKYSLRDAETLLNNINNV